MSDKYRPILDALREGIPVLTVNRRLGRYLLRRYERGKIEAGLRTWDTPLVMPFSVWLRTLYRESWPEKPLLGEAASGALFKKIISRDSSLRGLGVTAPGGLARTACKAYKLLRRYKLRLPADETYLTEEARAFKGWLGSYEKDLRRLGVVDDESLIEEVSGLLGKGALTLPARVVLAGFDEITPAMESVLASLVGAGCGASFWPCKPGAQDHLELAETGAPEIREYPDMAGEVRAAARWTRTQVEEGRRTGIIVPELEKYRDLIVNEFSAELEPASALPWEPRREVFNISLGLSLDKEPLVRSALAIISISAGEVPMDTLGPVLGSPYFMSEESEHMAFAAFLRRLREGRRSALTLRGLKRIIDKSKKQQLPGLFQRLGLWIKSIKDNGGVRRLPGEWAACFDELLKGLAWPSPALTLDSREYQALTAWHKLLGEFAGLDDVLGGLTWAGAAEELRAMAREAIHQPESVVESPVEVLGLLEASGMEFDATWLLGAHEDALPDRPAPNPFIPIYLQKEAGLPRATPELALEYGRAMLDRVLRSAPSVTVSFPRAAEGKELKVTPLLWGMGSYIKDPLLLRGHRLSHSVHASSVVEEFIDDKGPPLLGEELTGLRGGTGIIKEQSACPFRAFAMYRLGACGVSPPGPGLDPRERGSLVHEALKFFWRAVKDSEKLAEFHRDGTLFSLIGEAVEKALKPLVDKHRRPGLSKKILEVEAGRLQALLMDWMEVELKRVAFTVVETEKEHEVHVGGLRLRVFLDRVDELNDGKRIIIDYKTGACNKYDWLPKRPKEPQMLLYALEGGFNAIAFASLKRGEKLSFVGLGEEDGMLPRVRGIESDDKWRARAGGVDNWAVLNERWKETLTRLAADFQSGEASVDPNRETGDIEWPCKYCEFPMFCRKFELGFLNEEEEEEEDSVYG